MRRIKKASRILSSLFIAMAIAGCSSQEEDTFIVQELQTQEWSGEIASKFNGGTGTQADPFQIATGSQLALIGKSAPANKYYVMTQDINLKEIPWTPVNLNSGKLDGGNHTIKGLNTKSGTEKSALFSNTTGAISNLHVDGATIKSGSKMSAVICAEVSGGTISNCTVSNANVSDGATASAGSIAGSVSNATISNCSASSVHIKGEENIGGIVGYNAGKITGCKVENSDVTSNTNYAGGISGLSSAYTSDISDCTVSGTTVKAANENAGGITGKAETTISGNKVERSHISAQNFAGGITGWSESTVKDCNVTGTDITALGYCAGGITGDSDNVYNENGSVSRCYTSGCKVVANSLAGGIASRSQRPIKDCHVQNTTISSTKYYSAGIVTYLGGNVVVTDCTVEGSEVTSKGSMAGGAIGEVLEESHMGGNDACTFSNIQVSNTNVVGTDSVGGIFGSLDHSRASIRARVIGCKFSGSVTGRNNVGGIAGFTEGTNYENCSVEADVTGNSYVGGILGMGLGYCEYVRCCSVRGLIRATEKCAAGIAGTYYGISLSYNYIIGNVFGADSDCIASGGRVSGSFFVRTTDDKSVPWRWEDNQYSRIYTSACSDLVTDIAAVLKERVTNGSSYYNFDNTFVAAGCTCPRLIWE